MKKITLIAGLVFGLVTSMFAQEKAPKFAIRPTLGYAVGQGPWAILHGVGGSAEFQFQTPLSDSFSLMTSIGFGKFTGVESQLENVGTTILPIMAGIEYDAKKLHLGMALGYTNTKLNGSSSVDGFSLRPEIGLNISKKFQLNLNYNHTSVKGFDVTYLGISPVIKF